MAEEVLINSLCADAVCQVSSVFENVESVTAALQHPITEATLPWEDGCNFILHIEYRLYLPLTSVQKAYTER